MTVAEGCMLGEPLVRKAIALDENDVEARARLALTALLKGDIEGAFQEAGEVLSVNGNCANALGVKAPHWCMPVVKKKGVRQSSTISG